MLVNFFTIYSSIYLLLINGTDSLKLGQLMITYEVGTEVRTGL
jgi:hypothetical protein